MLLREAVKKHRHKITKLAQLTFDSPLPPQLTKFYKKNVTVTDIIVNRHIPRTRGVK